MSVQPDASALGTIDRRFRLTAHGSRISTEIVAGLTTFVTMASIIFVQPAVLGAAGMDAGAVLTATCLSTALASVLMGLLVNYPIAVAPAMGHNFFFAYSVVITMKVPWPLVCSLRPSDFSGPASSWDRRERSSRSATCTGRRSCSRCSV